jgi:hypothetical protein
MYFGPEVDLSIIQYNSTTDESERSVIYAKEIKAAFEKLVENIIHTFKFYYTDGQTLEQVQHEVVSFLVEKLPKFNKLNGKAFSYFSIIAKNYCIHLNKNNYKKLKSHNRIDTTSEINLEALPEDSEQAYNKSDFMDLFVEYWDEKLLDVFPKKGDAMIAEAIVHLFRKRSKLDLYNKKALYIYIREMTDASTQQITRMVKIMKSKYKSMYQDYIEYGKLDKSRIY